MSRYFNIGKIVNTQGIKGDVRVIPTTDDIKRFDDLEYVYLTNEKESDFSKFKKYNIEKVWYHKQFVILKFKEVANMNDAEQLKTLCIKIPEELALPLEEGEYYIRDLYGLKVFTEEDEYLGELVDIIETGSNDVYVVKDNATSKEILLPAIKQCIKEVNINEGKMIVHLMEGLRD